eukprot:CAMPEP_0114225168 /NCGR_PEP_ID=MMETSP0058-20121206/514_1 /TAXON_ID=36894 /ORGANISM="Pyramimonas parkeae, CCMP726" /LENGTH=228 /DNA_ID=CAMNT_0001335727 /DNA_START=124 /DNA_END=810 /DNA_ORIENTATION=+
MSAAAFSTSFVGRVAPIRSQRLASNNTGAKCSMKALPSWCPGAPRPAYLDGSMTGDYGFDPLGLGADPASLARFQEAELISSRWAMLGAAGVIAVEALGYGTWLDAPTATTQTYFGAEVPFDIATLCGIEFVAMAYLEAKRNEETDPVKRCYPGGAFDPMGMSKDPNNFAKMKAKEIANGRLAMLAMLGFYAQTSTGTSPLANLAAHVADPWHANVSLNHAALPFPYL